MVRLKLLDRVNGCSQCILDENGNHQHHCWVAIEQRLRRISRIILDPNPLRITLALAEMERAA